VSGIATGVACFCIIGSIFRSLPEHIRDIIKIIIPNYAEKWELHINELIIKVIQDFRNN